VVLIIPSSIVSIILTEILRPAGCFRENRLISGGRLCNKTDSSGNFILSENLSWVFTTKIDGACLRKRDGACQRKRICHLNSVGIDP
jgi:hypothetical protein